MGLDDNAADPGRPEWYHTRNGKPPSGPFTQAQLRDMAASGALLPTDVVWKDGMAGWLPAAEVAGLLPSPAPAEPLEVIEEIADLEEIEEIKEIEEIHEIEVVQQVVRQPAARAVAVVKGPVPAPGLTSSVVVTAAPKKAPIVVARRDVLLEVTACYRGGHPDFPDMAVGQLRLHEDRLEFSFEVDAPFLRVPYKSMVKVTEPQKGDYPEQMVKSAQMRKTGGQVIGFASGILGATAGALTGGDRIAANVTSGVGKTVAGTLKETSALGPPPKNRLCVVLRHDDIRHKVYFDVIGKNKEEMEKQAQAFWNRAAQVQRQFGKGSGGSRRREAPGVSAAGVVPQAAALLQFKELLDQGVLTQEEFDQQKAVILRSTQAPALPGPSARVVGCPQCQSKLRVRRPGLVQCPRCRAKVRAGEALFS